MKISTLTAVVVSLAAALPSSAASTGRRVFTDAEIVAVVDAANQGEIDAAQLASGKARDGGVKDFAEHMTKEHGDAKQDLLDVEAKAGLKPVDSDFSMNLAKQASDEAGRLGGLDGETFDRDYVEAQVADHAALLKALDEDLIPSAKAPALAALLRKIRPVVARHLAKARRLEAALERTEK